MPDGHQHSSRDEAPDGFVPTMHVRPFEHFAGPFYERAVDDGIELGFRVRDRHLNATGACHGGVLATFADIQGYALKKLLDLAVATPTITLSVDYLAPARDGDWVLGRPQLVKQTGKMLFFQSLCSAGEETVLRVNGIYRLTRAELAGPNRF